MESFAISLALIHVVPKFRFNIQLLDKDGKIAAYVREQVIQHYPIDIYEMSENVDSLAFSVRSEFKKEFRPLIDATCKLCDIPTPLYGPLAFEDIPGAADNLLRAFMGDSNIGISYTAFESCLEVKSKPNGFTGYVNVINHGLRFYHSWDEFGSEYSWGYMSLMGDLIKKGLKDFPLGELVGAHIYQIGDPFINSNDSEGIIG